MLARQSGRPSIVSGGNSDRKDNRLSLWRAAALNPGREAVEQTPQPERKARVGVGLEPFGEKARELRVLAAKDEARKHGYRFDLGFNATPSFSPHDEFWPGMAALGSASFIEALDYVGLDFFPDVFRPLPQLADGSSLPVDEAVKGVLAYFRTVNLRDGQIPPAVPIHITENGWPTSPSRSHERQAQVLETTLRAIYARRQALNITQYAYFGLRDIDSASADLQFGLLADDDSPKPAFERYRQLVAEMSVGARG